MKRLRSRGIHWIKWREYELSETGVKVCERDFGGVREAIVNYDCIGKEAAYFLTQSIIAKFGMGLFLILSIITRTVSLRHGNIERLAWVFWVGAAIAAFVCYLISRREGFRLASSYGSLVIIGKKSEVKPFIQALQDRKLKFIRENVESRISIMGRLEGEKYLLALKEGYVLTPDQYDWMRLKTGLDTDPSRRFEFEFELRSPSNPERVH